MRVTEVQLLAVRRQEVQAIMWGVSEHQRMVALEVTMDISILTKLRSQILSSGDRTTPE